MGKSFRLVQAYFRWQDSHTPQRRPFAIPFQFGLESRTIARKKPPGSSAEAGSLKTRESRQTWSGVRRSCSTLSTWIPAASTRLMTSGSMKGAPMMWMARDLVSMMARVQAQPLWASVSIWASSMITQLPLRPGFEHLDRGCCDCRTVHRDGFLPGNRLQGTPRLFKVLKPHYARSLRGDRYQPDPAFTNSFKAWKVFPLLVGPICRVACGGDVNRFPKWERPPAASVARSFLPSWFYIGRCYPYPGLPSVWNLSDALNQGNVPPDEQHLKKVQTVGSPGIWIAAPDIKPAGEGKTCNRSCWRSFPLGKAIYVPSSMPPYISALPIAEKPSRP